MTDQSSEQRARKACTLCRQRKRKCNGEKPCAACKKWREECIYVPRRHHSITHKAKRTEETQRGQCFNSSSKANQDTRPEKYPTVLANDGISTCRESSLPGDFQLRSLEANIPAVFVKLLGLNMEATALALPSRLQCYAWNLGFQSSNIFVPELVGITDLLTVVEMRERTLVFFAEVHPVYNFMDQESLSSAITQRWSSPTSTSNSADSVLCGVAVLAGLFCGLSGDTETRLSQMARIALEISCNTDNPTVDDVTAWLLRVIYLRMTSSPHTTWMACCTLMHMVEATKMHFDSPQDSILAESLEDCQPDRRRRIYCISQLFNLWVSADCGKSKVNLRGSSTQLPVSVWTPDQVALWSMSDFLDPDCPRDFTELENGLSSLRSIECSHSMLELLRCNIALCIFRRIRSLGRNMSDTCVEHLLSLADRALQSAIALIERRSPWWHIANIPFQLICVFLVIDSRHSFSRLPVALDVLRRVADTYKTKITQESNQVATRLVDLKRRQRLEDVTILESALSTADGSSLNFNIDRFAGSPGPLDPNNPLYFNFGIEQGNLTAYDLSQMFLPG